MFSKRSRTQLVAPDHVAGPAAGHSSNLISSLNSPISPIENVPGDGIVVVGKGTKITGEIRDATLIEIRGDFEGNVSANAVIVREGATLRGSIIAEYVEAHGLVTGSVVAQQLLDIRSTGHVTAEVRYGQLCVATGGRLSGDVQTQIIEGRVELRADEMQNGAASLELVNGVSDLH